MATVDAQTLRNIYYERYAALVNTTESFFAWRDDIVDADAGTPTNHSVNAWYLNRFQSDMTNIIRDANYYGFQFDIRNPAAEADIRRQICILIEEEDLADEFTAHIWEGEVMFDRTPLPRHISDDDDDYEQPEEATDPTAQVAPEAEISDDPSSTDDDLEEEDDYDEVAERIYSDYIEMIQRNRWQGDE